LFSEIHLNELRKLEQKLEQVSQNLEVWMFKSLI
jgi:hypothetical protein